MYHGRRRYAANSHGKLCGFGLLAFGTCIHLNLSFVPLLGKKPHFVVPVAASVIPLPALADFELPNLGLALSVVVVLGGAATALSWIASLKPRKTVDGQPRSTSLYRVFQARMRAGEFATLSKPEDDEGKGTSELDTEAEELDALVDAYVEGLEDDDGQDFSLSKEGKESKSDKS